MVMTISLTYSLKVCGYTDLLSLILKYQRNELHYKHSYSINSRTYPYEEKIKIQTLNFKKCTEVTGNHSS